MDWMAVIPMDEIRGMAMMANLQGELRSILVSPEEVARAAERPFAKKPRLS
jgi:hypothetical protein